MLSAVMHKQQDIRLVDRAVQDISEHEILLKVKAVGICGTDIRIYKNGLPGISEHSPRVLGHEFSGVIEKVGKHVTRYQEGMRVTVAPNIGCGICDNCVEGNHHHCTEVKAIGIDLDGGFAEYLRIPKSAIRLGNVVPIPDNVTYAEAAVVEPLSCVYSGFQKCPVYPGDTVLIIGAGPIGIMHALFAKLAGASKVIVSNRSTKRLEFVRQLDPSLITVPSADLKEEIDRLTNQKGVDVCVTACSSPEAQAMALELVGLNGRINFFGGLPKGKEHVLINSNLIHYKQITVTGTTKSNNAQFRKTLDFVSNGLIKVDQLITGRFRLEEFPRALEESMNGSGIKTLITFD